MDLPPQPHGPECQEPTWTPEWNIVNDMRSGSFFPDSGIFRFPLRPGANSFDGRGRPGAHEAEELVSYRLQR